MLSQKYIKELLLPVFFFVIFFVIESLSLLGEMGLFFSIFVILVITWYARYKHHELILFIVGILFGILIEIGLRMLGFQQNWNNASFFGIPTWLPLAWGVGFVFITRIGISIRSNLKRD